MNKRGAIVELFEEHSKDDERAFGELRDRLASIDTKVGNHLTETAKDIGEIRTDIEWIKRFFWVFATAAIGALVSSVVNLVIK